MSIYTQQNLARIQSDHCFLYCVYRDKKQLIDTDALVIIIEKLPHEKLYQTVAAEQANKPDLWEQGGIYSLTTLGPYSSFRPRAGAIIKK